MTKLLKSAIDSINSLPDEEQDAIAAIILEEIEDEVRWREAFARSQDALTRLASDARKEIAEGRANSYDPSSKGK